VIVPGGLKLAEAWFALVARAIPGSSVDDAAAVGAELFDAYGSPARSYHDLRHLTEVLDLMDVLGMEAAEPDLVRFAAWFHDAVYATAADAAPGSSEEASARMAEERLLRLGLPAAESAEVARLVRLTATHDPTDDDVDGAVLCDADLAVLARDEAGYRAYAEEIREEYAHVPDDAFRAGRAAVLQALLDQPRLFRTETGHALWEAAARANVSAELAALRA
jgi:predicted metal-dependent HD superfamily phosphohydrolase